MNPFHKSVFAVRLANPDPPDKHWRYFYDLDQANNFIQNANPLPLETASWRELRKPWQILGNTLIFYILFAPAIVGGLYILHLILDAFFYGWSPFD